MYLMTVSSVLYTTTFSLLSLLSLFLLLLSALQPASAQDFTISHTCVVPRYSVSLHEPASAQEFTISHTCVVPRYSVSLHEVNVTVETEALLLAEGRCYLRCMKTGGTRYVAREESVYPAWPFPIAVESCTIQQEIHECTRGCKVLILDTPDVPVPLTERRLGDDYHNIINTCIGDCTDECLEECGGATTCINPDTIDLWVAQSGCTNNCNNRIGGCHGGCLVGRDVLNISPLVTPTRPIAPPILTPLSDRPDDTFRAGAYSVDLTSAMPARPPRTPPLIGFLFRIYDNVSGNITYLWQHDPRDDLDLSSHACREVQVAFAVVSEDGPSEFSQAVSLTVYGDDRVLPDMVENIEVTDTEDMRIGFFQHVRIHVSWDPPQDDIYLTHFMVTLEYLLGDQTRCGVGNLTHLISYGADNGSYSITLEADSPEGVPVMGCTYQLTVTAVGGNGDTKERSDYTTSSQSVFMSDLISMTCPRTGAFSGLHDIFHWNFDVTWLLAEHVSYGDIVNSFSLTSKLLRVQENPNTRAMEEIKTTLEDFSDTAIASQSQYTEQIRHDGRLYRPVADDNVYFLFELVIEWNTRALNLFFPPPPYTYTCTESATSPIPSAVQNVSIQHYEMRSHTEFLVAVSWEPPLEVNGNLVEFSICLGLEILEGSRVEGDDTKCQNATRNLTETDSELLFTIARGSDVLVLYLQMRAWNTYKGGNWSDPDTIDLHVETTDRQTSVETVPTTNRLSVSSSGTNQAKGGLKLGIDEVLGITFGAIFGLVAIILCVIFTCACYVCLKRRKKMWKITQNTAHYDNMFATVSFGSSRPSDLLTHTSHAPVSHDDWEVPPSDIVVDQTLGEGAFGEVYKGYLKGPITCSKVMPVYRNSVHVGVAIKLLKDSAKGSERRDFLSEIDTMKKVTEGHSPHVVGMLGCVTLQEPLCLVTEFVKYGDLLSYLRSSRKIYITGTGAEDEDPYLELGKFAPLDLISFAYQIAAGMAYLSSIGIVHRDLACRNILVDEGKVLKITDFGMSRETEEVYIQQSKGRVPFKWMAIESILAREFTPASDVWAYGVVLWEIGTLGGVPYPGIANEDLLVHLKRGCRMEKPENCSSEMYEIMLSCWHEGVAQRPSFSNLQSKLDRMLSAEGNSPYLDFNINPSDLCYQVADEINHGTGHPPNSLLVPSGDKRKSIVSSRFGSQASSRSSLHMESPTSSMCSQLGKSVQDSPTIEKPHATNLLSLSGEGDGSRRPRSMMFLQRQTPAQVDDDRYVKDPSRLAGASLVVPNMGSHAHAGHVTGIRGWRRTGSDGAVFTSSTNGGPAISAENGIPPEIQITET